MEGDKAEGLCLHQRRGYKSSAAAVGCIDGLEATAASAERRRSAAEKIGERKTTQGPQLN